MPTSTEPQPKRPRQVRSAWPRLAGVLCLLTFAVSASGFLPALAAGLAQLDPQHRVLVEQSAGGLRLVLHHDSRACAHHQHRLAARLLLTLAAPQSDSDADHVLQFGGGSAQEKANESLTLPTQPEDEAPAPAEMPVPALLQPEMVRLIAAGPPPDSPSAATRIARSTTRQI